MHERLGEHKARVAARRAAAAYADSLAYAEPGRPQRKAGAAYAPSPLDAEDRAERLAELVQKAAVVPAWCQYAAPSGPAARHGAPHAPQPLSRADLAERLAELAQKEGARLALAELADSLAYADPGRPEKKVGPHGLKMQAGAALPACPLASPSQPPAAQGLASSPGTPPPPCRLPPPSPSP